MRKLEDRLSDRIRFLHTPVWGQSWEPGGSFHEELTCTSGRKSGRQPVKIFHLKLLKYAFTSHIFKQFDFKQKIYYIL
jgi:hypothetical protein